MLEQSAEVPVSRNLQRMHKLRLRKAAVSEAQALEAETRLLAPISGTVSKTYGKPSELLLLWVYLLSAF